DLVVTVLDDDGAPVEDAWVFGQTRSDLLALTDEDGRAIMDLPSRNTFSPHLAWTAERWPVEFDPMRTRRLPLGPPVTSKQRRIKIRSVETGEELDRAV